MTDTIVELIKQLQYNVPLELYIFLAAFFEEVIPPVPSGFFYITAGSMAVTQEKTWIYLSFLAAVGAIGKTIGSYIIYYVSDKLEDVIVPRFGKFIGVSHADVESFGKRFHKGHRDDIIMFILRVMPVVPSTLVSVGSGILKINLRTYIVQTFLGTFIKNHLYLYIGFGGISLAQQYVSEDSFAYYIGIQIALTTVSVIGLWLWGRHTNRKKEAYEPAGK